MGVLQCPGGGISLTLELRYPCTLTSALEKPDS